MENYSNLTEITQLAINNLQENGIFVLEDFLDSKVCNVLSKNIIETIEKELDIVAGYEDKLNILKKYFSGTKDKEVLSG